MVRRLGLVALLMLVVAIPSALDIGGRSQTDAAEAGGGGGGRGANAAISQLRNLPGDHRTATRAKTMRRAFELSLDSPITGWGPGASASGLAGDFLGNDRVHVTPHNGALGLLFEAGVGALIFFLLIIGNVLLILFRQIREHHQMALAGTMIAAAVPLTSFWLLGDGLAALPVSLCLMLIIGIFASGWLDHENTIDAGSR